MLICIDKIGSAIEFFDPRTCRSIARIATSPAPHDVALSRDKKRAYVTLYGNGKYKANPEPGSQILVVDLDSGTVVEVISLSPFHSPHGIALDAEGLLWVTCDPHARILAVNPQTKQIIAEIDTRNDGTHWVVASPVSGRLFCSSKEHRMISVIDPRHRKLIKQIETPHGTEGIALSPDGTLYVADDTCLQVLVVDGERLEVTSILALHLESSSTKLANQHMRLAVSPDGRTLAVAAYSYDRLLLVSLDEAGRQVAIRTGAGPMALEFSPVDPDILYLSNHDAGTLAVVNLVEGAIERTFACGKGVEALRFVP